MSDSPGEERPAPDLAEALKELGETGRAGLSAAGDAAKALRILIAADIALVRSAFGRTLAFAAVAIAFGASAWLLLMATLKSPKLLLLDEHTAALDPKTAAKVMELTDRIVTKEKLTTLMITHNMRDAIQYGSRLIMLHEGRVILDISDEEKKQLTVTDLLAQFAKVSGDEFASDRALLS